MYSFELDMFNIRIRSTAGAEVLHKVVLININNMICTLTEKFCVLLYCIKIIIDFGAFL